MFYSCFIFVSLVAVSLATENTNHETCRIELQLYGDLCYSPKFVSRNMTVERFNDPTRGPKDAWPIEIGDEVGRNHLASNMKSKKLNLDDDYENMCLEITKATSEYENKANGFGVLHASGWTCSFSKDIDGTYRCLYKNEKTDYQEEMTFYFTDTKEENIFVTVMCFSNGDVGWHSLSENGLLSEDQKVAIQNHVKQLGFAKITGVPMYTASCNELY